jgi:glycine cleavage system aminomethyltransferase T
VSTKQGGPNKRMVNILINDPEPLMHHGEILWRNKERISDIRSASYGHTLGGAVGLSMLDRHHTNEPISKEYIHNGQWEVEIAHQRYPCQLSFSPFYDPKGDRIKV